LQTDCNILRNQLDEQQQVARKKEKVSFFPNAGLASEQRPDGAMEPAPLLGQIFAKVSALRFALGTRRASCNGKQVAALRAGQTKLELRNLAAHLRLLQLRFKSQNAAIV